MASLFVSVTSYSQTSRGDQSRAEKAWDALIKAKGGRERLHSVTNMVVERDDWTQLYVFPNLEWTAWGPFFGNRHSEVFYRDKSLLVKSTQDGELETRTNYPWDWNVRNQLMFILETKWDRPFPVTIERRKEGKETFDVIETQIGKLKVEFAYEPEVMLVRRVYFYENGLKTETWALDVYRLIDGVQMPTLVAMQFGKQSKFKLSPITFRFNVEYNPQIFERPLKSTTVDAWKPK